MSDDLFPDVIDPMKRIALLEARVRVQNTVLHKLPRTADGEFMLPGKSVYQVINNVSLTKHGQRGVYVCEREVQGIEMRRGKLKAYMADDYFPDTPVIYWADREAAEKAATGNRKKV